MSLLEAIPETPTSDSGITTGFERADGKILRTLSYSGRTSVTSVPDLAPEADGLSSWWRAYLGGETPHVVQEGLGGRPLRTVELFCGPGGLALGFRQACLELGSSATPLFVVDQDEEAVQVHARNHGSRVTSTASVGSLVDYHVRGSREKASFHYPPEIVDDSLGQFVGEVDVVLAGPPCQGHSNLNNQSRRSDPRNELYMTVPAIALALGAPIVIIENVPAVVHDDLGVVAATKAILKAAGYSVTTEVISAAKMGWSQTRSRFFLVARKDRPVVDLMEVQEAFSDDARNVMWAMQGAGELEDPPYMTELADLSAENLSRIKWLFDNKAHDLALSERPDCHKDGTTYTSVYGRLHADKPSPTITTGFMTPGRGRYIHPIERRLITPREAARIQAFPDTYCFAPNDEAIPSKKKITKWIGDAVPMPLGHAAAMAALLPGW